MTHTPPPNIDYTTRDFAGFRESLLAYAAQRMPEWRGARSGDPNDFGVMLVELFAYEADVLSFYIDRLATESFLATAVHRDSVLMHAAMLDYTPRSATPATVPLTFTVTTTTAAITVPAGFKVMTGPAAGDTPLVFETVNDIVFVPAADGTPRRQSLDVIAVEGQTVADERLGVHCGEAYEAFQLAQAPVLADSVKLRVVERPDDLGQVWQRVSNLLDAGPGDNAYVLRVDANEAVHVSFGDGVNGRIPPRGSVVWATYRVGGGDEGNVDDGVITDPLDPDDVRWDDQPGTDDDDDVVVDRAPLELVVVNHVPARGGADAESLESIRKNAPRARQTGRRAVSLSDYETLALTVPGVQLAKAKAVAHVYTNVTLFVAPPGGGQPDSGAMKAVVAYTLPRKMAGVTVVVASPSYVPVDLTMHLLVDSRYSQASVRNAVRTAMEMLLDFDHVDFGQRVSLSSVYAAVIAVQGVRNVIINGLGRTGSTPGLSDVRLLDHEIPMLGTVTLTAEGGVIAQIDPSGGDTGTRPVASPQPRLQLLRCDPTSTHVELIWTPGDATSHWDVEVQYRDVADGVVSTTIAGPFAHPSAFFDLPRIGAGRAVSIHFRTRAYNGTTGPESSPWLETPYTCEP